MRHSQFILLLDLLFVMMNFSGNLIEKLSRGSVMFKDRIGPITLYHQHSLFMLQGAVMFRFNLYGQAHSDNQKDRNPAAHGTPVLHESYHAGYCRCGN